MAGPRHPGPIAKNDRDALVEVMETRRRVLDLWREGWHYRMIAAETGYSVWSVGECVRRALRDLRSNSLAEYRDEHLARLEELFRAIYPAVMEACPLRDDVTAALSILDREARLLGLDAPKKSLSVGIPANDDAWQDVIRALATWLGQQEAQDSGRTELDAPQALDTGTTDSALVALSALEAANDMAPVPVSGSRDGGEGGRGRRERRAQVQAEMEAIYAI